MNTNHLPQIVQELFKNVQAGGDISVGDITQVFQNVNNLNDWDKPLGFPHNIPNSNTQKFVGRENELVLIHQHLQTSNHAVISAVEGMGGIGKTELATQYSLLHLFLNSYPGGICWLSATNQNLGLQIIQFCRTHLGLNPPDDFDVLLQVKWCWQRWQQGKVLVVLDDVQNYPAIQPYLPPQPSQFKVLITTRLKLDLSGSLSLQILSESEALALLSELIGADKLIPKTAQAEELCQRLGYLPLALQLVSRYIKKRKISLAEMLKRLEAKGLGHPALVVDINDPTWTLSITRGVEAAFALSWEVLSPAAQELGCLLSLFALAPISWSLVESAAPEKDTEDLEDARIELEQLHLLQSEDNYYQLHQLIREFLKKKHNNLASGQQQISHFCQAMVNIAQEIPAQPIQKDIQRFKLAIPHLQEVADHLLDTVSDENLIWPFVGVKRFYQGQGLYNDAEPWLKKCVLLLKQRLGNDHPHVATSLNNLAALYESQGRYNEAEPLYQQALALRQKLLGNDHFAVAASLNNLALLYESQGKYNEAKPLHEQALALLQKRLGNDHPAVATSLNNLASLYKSQGKYNEAEPLYQQALALSQKLLGNDNPHVATSLNNLAELYYFKGKYNQAEPLYQQALALWQKLLGDDHPHVATSLNNLAKLYESQGRYNEAEPLYQQALALREKLLGNDHPDVAESLNDFARLYYFQGKYKEAEPLYQQSLALRQKLLGDDHPDVAQSLNNLAGLYQSQGKYNEAEPLYQQALALSQKLLGDDHPDVATSLNNLALLYESQGKYKEAEPLYQQALNICKQRLGVDHPRTITVRDNLELLRNR
ncbi:MAG: tetratricopeptide repeat protein [Dolichospermum sp. DET73]|nr:tetratricopeptide repeat protein [Dolichospermum sp. DET73]